MREAAHHSSLLKDPFSDQELLQEGLAEEEVPKRRRPRRFALLKYTCDHFGDTIQGNHLDFCV